MGRAKQFGLRGPLLRRQPGAATTARTTARRELTFSPACPKFLQLQRRVLVSCRLAGNPFAQITRRVLVASVLNRGGSRHGLQDRNLHDAGAATEIESVG